jgi:hypothetical protein
VTKQPSLFNPDDLPLETAPSLSASKALSIRASNKTPLTPAQRSFQANLAKVQKLKDSIVSVTELTDRFRLRFQVVRTPVVEQMCDTIWAFVLAFEQASRVAKLTASQKALANELQYFSLLELMTFRQSPEVCDMAERYAKLCEPPSDREEIDEEDKNGEGPLGSGFPRDFDEARQFFQELSGLDTSGIETEEALEEFVRRFFEGKQDDRFDERRRKPKKSRKQSKRAAKEELDRADADLHLRSIYRELTRVLHPDRETDPEEQRRKTDLMGMVNAAYGRRDLMALLEIQLRIEQVSADKIREMTDARLSALSRVLKEQVPVLEAEWRHIALRFLAAVNLDYSGPLSEVALERQLQGQLQDLKRTTTLYAEDLIDIQKHPNGLRKWLNKQRDAS